jgi:hypothetical protein
LVFQNQLGKKSHQLLQFLYLARLKHIPEKKISCSSR